MNRPRRAALWVGIAAILSVFACGEADESASSAREAPPEAPETTPEPEEAPGAEAPSIGRPPESEAERRAADEARAAAQHLGRTLKTRLMAAMAEGPDAAVRVCAEEAQALTRQAAEAQDAQVGRSALKLRNPENRGPAWVTAWLEAHGERPAEGVAPRVGITGQPAVARFVGPIALEGPCLMCHGAPEGIPAAVRSVLAERYPEDAATGYAAGDLRGAIWAEVPVGGAAEEGAAP